MTLASVTPSPLSLLTVLNERYKDVSHGSNENESITPPKPKLRLHIQDARHAATSSFLRIIPDLQVVLDSAIAAIVEQLYTPPSSSRTPLGKTPSLFSPEIPPTRSVTVILEDFSGIAYTKGSDLDDDHKEIHFGLSYINDVCKNNADPLGELKGVLTHELVHCYQHTTPRDPKEPVPSPPGGLIEGIADFVRLKAGFVPLHWERPTSAKDRPLKWDEGYQHTAFFLEWLEDKRVGRGAVGLLNDRLLRQEYVGETSGKEQHKPGFWKGLFGVDVSELWEEYGRYLDQ